jgi:hypothetical protein
MMGRWKILRGLTAVLLVGGVGVLAAGPAEAKESQAKKSVCLISEISQRFQLKKIGIMVFGNEEKTIPIPSWKLEDKIYAKAKALLAKNFQVKQLPAPYEVFQPLHEQGDLFRDKGAELQAMVRKVAAGSSCDFYLAITCGGSQVGSSNQYLTGLGVLEATNIFNDDREIYALSYMQVYDGKSFEVVKAERGQSDKDPFFEAIRGPSQRIDGEAHASLQAVADDPKTREIVWAQLERSLDLTLPELFDVGELDQAARLKRKPKSKSSKPDWVPF